MPTAPSSTLQTIQNKVRRLTRTPSEAQLSNDALQEYINTFLVYDMPEHLRLFNLRTTFSFYCAPNIDTYITDDTLPTTDPLYNFKNIYLSMASPIFIAGYQRQFSESRSEFYAQYPLISNIQSIGVKGNGLNTIYSGTLSAVPVLQNQVLFSSVDVNNGPLTIIDRPVSALVGDLYDVITGNNAGLINYITGEWDLEFQTAPADGQAINSQTVPYQASLPLALLYYDNKFTLRPVPDQPYKINFEAYIRPTYLMSTNQSPYLEEWWQYIAYGAAKKIFEDRMDMESVQMIMPEFKKQELLVQRRTIVQYTSQRAATIYTEYSNLGGGIGGWGWGGGLF